MEDVRRRIPHTIRRNGIYYFQRRVPLDLVEAFGIAHFKESLGTADGDEAERRIIGAQARYFEAVDEKRKAKESGSAANPVPSSLKLNALRLRIREYVSAEAFARRAALSRNWSAQPGSRSQARAEIVTAFKRLRDPGEHFTRAHMEAVAIALVPENQFDNPDLGPMHNLWHPINKPFRDMLHRALVEIERRTLKTFDGDYSTSGLDPLFTSPPIAAAPGQAAKRDEDAQGTSLAELSALRLAAHAKGSVRKQRLGQLTAAHGLILRHFGNETKAAAITPAMCGEFRDILAILPRDLSKRFPASKSLTSIAAAAKDDKLPTLARATQETYLGALRDLLRWGEEYRHIPKSPVPSDLKSPTLDRPRARVDFSEAQLLAITEAEFMRGWDRMEFSSEPTDGLSAAIRYWVPRIGLFAGMRQNEICQLDVADVRHTASGVYYFAVDDDQPDKQLKNKTSRRAVPIHHRLIAAGFLEYSALVGNAGHRKLFPGLKLSAYGHYGEQFSKWITRQLRGAGFPTGVDFHAFRHTFAQALRHIDAPIEVGGRLGGWTVKTGVMGRYGGALSDRWIDHLNVTLQRLSFGKADDAFFCG